MKKPLKILLLNLFLILSSSLFAQTATISGIINTYAKVTAIDSSGCPVNLTLGSSAGYNVGDTVLISSIGYVHQMYVVPPEAKEFTSVIFEMHQDNIFLKTVVITMPTEELFKEAVLALNVPLDDTGIDPKNLNAELLALMVRTTPMDGNANYRYYISQYSNSFGDKFHPLYNPFLNPLNWVKFIKDLKKKKREEDKATQSKY